MYFEASKSIYYYLLFIISFGNVKHVIVEIHTDYQRVEPVEIEYIYINIYIQRPATYPTPAKCRYGVRCNNFYCNFQHPVPRQGAELCSDNCEDKKCQKFHLYKNNITGNCKFQDNCERPLCSLKHPNVYYIILLFYFVVLAMQ